MKTAVTSKFKLQTGTRIYTSDDDKNPITDRAEFGIYQSEKMEGWNVAYEEKDDAQDCENWVQRTTTHRASCQSRPTYHETYSARRGYRVQYCNPSASKEDEYENERHTCTKVNDLKVRKQNLGNEAACRQRVVRPIRKDPYKTNDVSPTYSLHDKLSATIWE